MLASLPYLIRVPLALVLLAVNLLCHVVPLFAMALLKMLVPIDGFRRACGRILVTIAESWIAINSAMFAVFTRTRWAIEIDAELNVQRNYLVLCNHQSWVDIPVLQKIFNRRIPFLRFFLKRQLIWVPLLGVAWWALDFPFMRRYSKQALAANPELRGKDMDATRRACEKFRSLPVSVMNFVEGTRFTAVKHAAQSSPYIHLLKPRAGGVAFVLDAMGDALHAILDVTIVYPGGRPGMGDLIADRIGDIRVHVRELPIERDLRGDYEGDAAYRTHFQSWINTLWTSKDRLVAALTR
ncbi:MAG: acyltransferase [Dokdonella sp.]|uniref:acyltransferase n=1 Tax=Dokdonella sp. TaxID=2291710 RepID=UPI003262DAD3